MEKRQLKNGQQKIGQQEKWAMGIGPIFRCPIFSLPNLPLPFAFFSVAVFTLYHRTIKQQV